MILIKYIWILLSLPLYQSIGSINSDLILGGRTRRIPQNTLHCQGSGQYYGVEHKISDILPVNGPLYVDAIGFSHLTTDDCIYLFSWSPSVLWIMRMDINDNDLSYETIYTESIDGLHQVKGYILHSRIYVAVIRKEPDDSDAISASYISLFEPGIANLPDWSTDPASASKLTIIQNLPTHGRSHLELFSREGENFLAITNLEISQAEKHKIEFLLYKWDHAHMDVFLSRETSYAIRNKIFTIDDIYYLFVLQEQGKDGDPEVGSPLYIIDFDNKKTQKIQLLETNKPTDVTYIDRNNENQFLIITNSDGKTDIWGWMYGQQFVKYQSLDTPPKPIQCGHFALPTGKIGLLILEGTQGVTQLFLEARTAPSENSIFANFVEQKGFERITGPDKVNTFVNIIQTPKGTFLTICFRRQGGEITSEVSTTPSATNSSDTEAEEDGVKTSHVYKINFAPIVDSLEPTKDPLLETLEKLFLDIQLTVENVQNLNKKIGTLLLKTIPQNISKDVIIYGDLLVDGTVAVENLQLETKRTEFPVIDLTELENLRNSTEAIRIHFDDILYSNQPNQTLNGIYHFEGNEFTVNREFSCPHVVTLDRDINGIDVEDLYNHCLMDPPANPFVPPEVQIVSGLWTVAPQRSVYASYVAYEKQMNDLGPQLASLRTPELVLESATFEDGLHVKGNLFLGGTLNGMEDFMPQASNHDNRFLHVKAKKTINGNLIITGQFDVISDTTKLLNVKRWMDSKLLTINSYQVINAQLIFDAPVELGSLTCTKLINGIDVTALLNNVVLSTDYSANTEPQIITGKKTFQNDVRISNEAQFLNLFNDYDLSKDIVVITKHPTIFSAHKFVFMKTATFMREVDIGLINGRNFSEDILTRNSLQKIKGKWTFANDVEFMAAPRAGEYKNVIEAEPGVRINGYDLSETVHRLLQRGQVNVFREEVTFETESFDIEGNSTIKEGGKINDLDINDITQVWTKSTDQVIPLDNLIVQPKVTVKGDLTVNGRINGHNLANDFVFLKSTDIQIIKSPIIFTNDVAVQNLIFAPQARLNGIQPAEYLSKVIYADSDDDIVEITGKKTFTANTKFGNDVHLEGLLNGYDLKKDFLLNGTSQYIKATDLAPQIMVVVGGMDMGGDVKVTEKGPGGSKIQDDYDIGRLCDSIVHPGNRALRSSNKGHFDTNVIPNIKGTKVFASDLTAEHLTVLYALNDVKDFTAFADNVVTVGGEGRFEGRSLPKHVVIYAPNLTFAGTVTCRAGVSVESLTPGIAIGGPGGSEKVEHVNNLTEYLSRVIDGGQKTPIAVGGLKTFVGPVTLVAGLSVAPGHKVNEVDLEELKVRLLDLKSRQRVTARPTFGNGLTIKNLVLSGSNATLFGYDLGSFYRVNQNHGSDRAPNMGPNPEAVVIEDDVIFQNDVLIVTDSVTIKKSLNGMSIHEILSKGASSNNALTFTQEQFFEDLTLSGNVVTLKHGLNHVDINKLASNILLQDVDQTIYTDVTFAQAVKFEDEVLFNQNINDVALSDLYKYAFTRNGPQTFLGNLTVTSHHDHGSSNNGHLEPLRITVLGGLAIHELRAKSRLNDLDLETFLKHAVYYNIPVKIKSRVIFEETATIHMHKNLMLAGSLNSQKFPEDYVLLDDESSQGPIHIPGQTTILYPEVKVDKGITVKGKIDNVDFDKLIDDIVTLEAGNMEIRGAVKFLENVYIKKNVVFQNTLNQIDISKDLVLKQGDFDIVGKKTLAGHITVFGDIYGTTTTINDIDIVKVAESLAIQETHITLKNGVTFKENVKILGDIFFHGPVNGVNFSSVEREFEEAIEDMNVRSDNLARDITTHDIILQSQTNASLNQPTLLAYWELSQTWDEMTETFRYDFLSYHDSHFIYKWVNNNSGCPNMSPTCRCDQMELFELRKDGKFGEKEILGYFRDFPMSVDTSKYDVSRPLGRNYVKEHNDIMIIVSTKSISYSPLCVSTDSHDQTDAESTSAFILGNVDSLDRSEHYDNISTKSSSSKQKSAVSRSKEPLSTLFVTDSAYFYRNGNLYIVIINHFDKVSLSHNVNSYLYKFNYTEREWVKIQDIATRGAVSCTIFVSSTREQSRANPPTNNLYVAIANSFDSEKETYSTHSFIFVWDDGSEQFRPIKSVHTETARDVVSVTIRHSGYVIFANEKTGRSHDNVFNDLYEEPIMVLYHDELKNDFVRIQDHYIPGIQKIEVFNIGDDNFYLAAVSPVVNKIFIYKWKEYLMFSPEMEIPLQGSKSIHSFWDRGNLYMAVGNLGAADCLLVAKIRSNKESIDIMALKHKSTAVKEPSFGTFWWQIQNEIHNIPKIPRDRDDVTTETYTTPSVPVTKIPENEEGKDISGTTPKIEPREEEESTTPPLATTTITIDGDLDRANLITNVTDIGLITTPVPPNQVTDDATPGTTENLPTGTILEIVTTPKGPDADKATVYQTTTDSNKIVITDQTTVAANLTAGDRGSFDRLRPGYIHSTTESVRDTVSLKRESSADTDNVTVAPATTNLPVTPTELVPETVTTVSSKELPATNSVTTSLSLIPPSEPNSTVVEPIPEAVTSENNIVTPTALRDYPTPTNLESKTEGETLKVMNTTSVPPPTTTASMPTTSQITTEGVVEYTLVTDEGNSTHNVTTVPPEPTVVESNETTRRVPEGRKPRLSGKLAKVLNDSGLLDFNLHPGFHFLNTTSDHIRNFLPQNLSADVIDNLLKGIEEELAMDYEIVKGLSLKETTTSKGPLTTPPQPVTTKSTVNLLHDFDVLTTPRISDIEDYHSETIPIETTTRRVRKPEMSKLKPGGTYFSRRNKRIIS